MRSGTVVSCGSRREMRSRIAGSLLEPRIASTMTPAETVKTWFVALKALRCAIAARRSFSAAISQLVSAEARARWSVASPVIRRRRSGRSSRSFHGGACLRAQRELEERSQLLVADIPVLALILRDRGALTLERHGEAQRVVDRRGKVGPSGRRELPKMGRGHTHPHLSGRDAPS